jgi:hypothetical protein
MTPQEKAKQLYGKYYGIPLYIKTVKECCHIAVNEIIETLNYDIKDLDVRGSVLIDLIIYWRQVKEEIDKL